MSGLTIVRSVVSEPSFSKRARLCRAGWNVPSDFVPASKWITVMLPTCTQRLLVWRKSPPLISVDKQLFDDPLRFAYALREQVEFLAHGRGYLGPFAQEPATSWAAPHLAGIAARLLSLRPDLKPFEVKALLYWMSRAPRP